MSIRDCFNTAINNILTIADETLDYTQDSNIQTDISCLAGTSDALVEDRDGLLVKLSDKTFRVKIADINYTPKAGDKINYSGSDYYVSGDNPYELDSFETTYLIHTKRG